MLAFEVWINGKKEYTVGFKDADEFGVYISSHPELQDDSASIEASGYALSGAEFPDEINWGSKSIKVGDEVVVKLVESENPDEPMRTKHGIGLTTGCNHAMLCSICGKSDGEIKSMIRANKIAVCNECLGALVDMSRDESET
jgi:hypothetical protein